MSDDFRPLAASQKRLLLALTRDDMTINDLMALGPFGCDPNAAVRGLELRGLITVTRAARWGLPNLYAVSVVGAAMQARLRAEGFLNTLAAADDDRPRVMRDPCPRCGVRGDIGCAHQSANWPAARLAVR